MKQIFQTYPSRLLLCLLFTLIGGGNFAWGETYSLTPDTESTGSSSTKYITIGQTFTYGGISWYMNQWNPKTLQIKTNQSSATSEFRFYNTSAFPGKITQVVITFSALTLSDANKLIFLGGTSEVTATTGGTAGTWNSTSKTLTWTPSESDNFTYFAFYQNGNAATGTNHLASSNAIVVTYEAASSSPLASIAVDATDATTVFHVGDTFTHEGAVVTATYKDESTKDVTADATFSTPDMTTAGTKTVTVTYTENEVEKSTSYDIEVKAPAALESISLSGSYPTEFTQGDAFSSEGIVVTANYDDETTKDVTEDAEFSGYNMSATGSQTVTVTYEGKTATYNITVNAYVQPTEFDIPLNDTFFGTNYGGTASGITDDTPVSASQDNVIVTYAGAGSHYINASQIRFYPNNKLTFEAPDGYNIVKIIFTSGGTWAATIRANKGTYTSDTKTWEGEATSVLFTGSGSSHCQMSKATITLEAIVPEVLSSIAISGEYPTTFYQGDAFSHEGMTVTATYESGKTANVTESATFSTPDMSTTGTKEVTVSYTENEVTKTATYEITVNAPATLTSISLSGDYPTEFEQGDEFSSEGIEVTANWSDETKTNVTADATFTGYDMSALGSQTVTVSYGGKTATYDITVNVKKGTEERPYTVAEAIAATPASGTSANVYIQGIVSAFYKTSVVDDGSNYRYYISDDGTTANQLLVYKGKGLEQSTFSSADDLRVGDEVTIVGGLTTYNSTKEVASNNYLVSRKTTPGIAWSETEFEANLGGSNTFPTLTNTNSVAVTYSSTNTDVATIASDGTITLVAAGETTIKATFAGNASYLAQEVSYVLTVVDPTVATIELSSYSIEATAAETDGTLTATYNHITEVEAEVQFCDAEGNDAEYDWIIAVINSSSKNVEYTIEANEGPARTAYFRVYALDDNTEDVYSEIVTVTQAKYIAPAKEARYALFTGDLVEGDYIISHEGEKAMKASVSSNRLEYVDITPTDNVIISSNANIIWHIAKNGDYWTIYNESEEKYAASTGTKNQANVIENGTTDNALWTANGTETFEFVNKANKAKGINANLRFNSGYGFACYATGTGKPLKLYRKVEQVEVTKAGYATYCSENALDFTGTGITAYVGTRFGDKLTFTPITQVPARTGLLLVCNGGTTANVPVLASAAAVGNNCLVGVTAATTIDAEDYILNVKEIDGEKKAGFFLAGSHTSLAANRAYIPASEGGSVKSFALDLEDNADGIEETLSDSLLKSENIYNLAGQRLSKMQKGINIVNGKKILK